MKFTKQEIEKLKGLTKEDLDKIFKPLENHIQSLSKEERKKLLKPIAIIK